MFRIAKTSAFVGDHEVELIEYSAELESRIKLPIELLRGVKISDYPRMLDCTLLLGDFHPMGELQGCWLYKAYSEEDVILRFDFGSPDGIWKNDVAIAAAQRELSNLVDEDKSYFEIECDDVCISFGKYLDKESSDELIDAVRCALSVLQGIVDKINSKIFGFIWKDVYKKDEPLFTKEVVIPILRGVGFDSVRYNHGVTEFGRDVLFSDIDKFANVRHYAAQVKAGDISASDGTLLNQLIVQIDDAFAMPVRGPGRSKQFHISELYVICSGKITQGAIDRLNQKLDPRLAGSVHFLDFDDIDHLAKTYLART